MPAKRKLNGDGERGKRPRVAIDDEGGSDAPREAEFVGETQGPSVLLATSPVHSDMALPAPYKAIEHHQARAAGSKDDVDSVTSDQEDVRSESPISIAASEVDDPLDMDDIPLALQKRLLKMRRENDAGRGTYYITKVPLDLAFGRADGFLDMRNFLVDGRNNAVKIFVSGILMAVDLWNSQGQPQRRISVVVKPLSNLDSMAAAKLHNEYSVPNERTTRDSFIQILASRWQTSYGAPRDSPGLPFKQVYLAEGSMKDRKYHSVDLLKPGDLVVLEMRLRSRRGDAGSRVVEFQLQTVSVLLRSARDVPLGGSDAVEDVDW
ncbi:hypothetical protein CALVIDRAFT_563002 [Calocera viscosa TUFC12733]|uniref:Uncharacterized protein n=1 Tax=Calocera viscosa (strain TUFC12733) TaxID=1330018 RepID=A0A167NFX1_CALVF|nr:hypothetical protein CALVIDRAFT_563002 [Calocera viscosa TUFC12733]